MINSNIEELDKILSDDLTYTHTSGWQETKAEFLSSLKAQKVNYQSIKPREIEVRVYQNTIVVTGISDMQVISQNQQFSFSIKFIEVYHKKKESWQLVAWQSLRLPENK